MGVPCASLDHPKLHVLEQWRWPPTVGDLARRDAIIWSQTLLPRVTDVTYIRTAEHWLYLCIMLDLYSGLVDE